MNLPFIRIIYFILSLVPLKTVLLGSEAPLLKPYKPQIIAAMLINAQKRTEHGEQDAFAKTLSQISSHNPELQNVQARRLYIDQLNLEQTVQQGLGLYLQTEQPIQQASSHFIPFFSSSDELVKKLLSLIKEETLSIKMAIYHITSPAVIDSLIKAKKSAPTLSIELCLDRYRHENKHGQEIIQKLTEAGINVYLVGGRKWDMHEKFIIFGKNMGQEPLVWQSSYNLTDEATRDNVIFISDKTIIESFNKRFDQLKTTTRDNIKSTPTSSSMPIVIFSPKGGIQQRIIDFIDMENHSIKMAMHTFYPETSVGEALLRAALRRIQVTLIINSNQFNDGSASSKAPITGAVIQRFKDAGINLYTYEGPITMHHKFFLFGNNKRINGNSLLITGSYNITDKAEDMNCEDVIVTDEREVTEKFNVEFMNMEKQARIAPLPISTERPFKRTTPDTIAKKPQDRAPKKMRQTTLMPFSYTAPASAQK